LVIVVAVLFVGFIVMTERASGKLRLAVRLADAAA
jgi:hypothetical protein